MEPRLNLHKVGAEVLKPMIALEMRLRESGLERSLFHLVKLRASQINGCAYCIKMHTREARHDGETEERLYLLDAWREAPVYTERERAALAWTEALTLIAQTRAPDEDYERMAAQFSAEEQVKLTLLIGAINTWNRLAISFRSVPEVEGPRVQVAA